MHYEITKEFIFIDVEKETGEKLGAVWNQKSKMFRLPNTIGVLRELWPYVKPSRNGKTYFVNYGASKVKARDNMLFLKNMEDIAGDDRLRPYQRVDVNYLKRLPSAGIFNEMRTGKTPTSLVLANEMQFKSIIIVCPAGLVLQWKEEVEKWTGKESIAYTGTKKKRTKYLKSWSNNRKPLIISYETLRNDLNDLKQMLTISDSITVDALIVDEAHRLRSLKSWRKASQQSKAVFELGRQAQHRYALTGTPTVSSGDEIFGILTFLYPKRFPGYWQFADRYFHVTKDYQVGQYKRQAELEEVLTLISVNRKRAEVMKWLPEKQYQTIHLELEGKQKKAYEEVALTFEYEEKGNLIVDAPGVLTQLLRLRQLTTGPAALGIDVTGVKEKFILEWLQDNPTESVIILSSFTSYLKTLDDKIKNSLFIHGVVSKKKRKEIENDFQAGKSKVLLANTRAVQEGLTLDKAETIIFIDKMYNPSDNQQAEDRIVPVSEERNHSMTVISLVVKDTIDEVIEYTLDKKLDITKIINDSGMNGLKRLMQEVKGK